MAINIKEVATAAGMSVSSVSRILNAAPGYTFNEDSQRRVWDAAERLGYQPSAAAQLLRRQKKTLVGLTSHFSEQPYANRLLMAVRNELLQRGYEPILMEPSQMVLSSSGSIIRSGQVFPSIDLLLGILSFGFAVGDEGLAYCLDMHRKVPLVALHPLPTDEVNWIYTDHERGIELVVDHLVSLGHRHIELALSSQSPHLSDKLKLRGWERATIRHQWKSVLPDLLPPANFSPIKERVQVIEDLLLSMDPRPTALICSGDESALSLMALLQKRGWDIPRDLSITGYDSIVFGEYVWPDLTTVLPPLQQIAERAVDRLLELVEDGNRPPLQDLLKPTLIVRNSTSRLTSDHQESHGKCSAAEKIVSPDV